MPTVNVYFRDFDHLEPLNEVVEPLRAHLSSILSHAQATLRPEEISVRLVRVSGGAMISPVELEITAHAVPHRVERQDEICLATRAWMKDRLPLLSEVRVWLVLVQLGHSWEPTG